MWFVSYVQVFIVCPMPMPLWLAIWLAVSASEKEQFFWVDHPKLRTHQNSNASSKNFKQLQTLQTTSNTSKHFKTLQTQHHPETIWFTAVIEKRGRGQ